MKSAREMYDERSTIQEGPLKEARMTLPDADIVQLMEDYKKQAEEEKFKTNQ